MADEKERADWGKSTKPQNVRARIRRKSARAKTITQEMELLPNYDVSTWDYEELARGRPRNKNGKFNGRRPAWVTPLILEEAQRRLRDLTLEEIAANAYDAVTVIANLMKDDSVDFDGKAVVSPTVRLNAAQFIVDHMIGKSKQRVDVDTGEKLTALLASTLVNPDGTSYAPVIEGQVVEDDDEEDEDNDAG